MSGMNKLVLRAFYEAHKTEYISRRNSGDTQLWDESYKWEIFPELNEKLAEIETVTKDNISEIVNLLIKTNPNQGSFAHWIDMDDLKLLAEKPNGFQIVDQIWDKNPHKIGEHIDTANNMSMFMLNKKFSPSTFGYMLAAQDASKFAIYLDKLTKDIAELNQIEKFGSLTQGQKYQLLNDSATFVGELMESDKGSFNEPKSYKTLNGQDFLYVTIQYSK